MNSLRPYGFIAVFLFNSLISRLFLCAATDSLPSPPKNSQPLTAGQVVHNIEQRRFQGEEYEFNLNKATLRSVLSSMSRITGMNIAVDAGIEGKVTVELRDTPWDAALAVILKMNRLRAQAVGNILWIEREPPNPNFSLSPALIGVFFLILIMGNAYLWFRRFHLEKKESKKRDEEKKKPLDPNLSEEVLGRLKRIMEKDKIFCDETLTLQSLAGRLDLPPYLLSRIINEKLEKTFPEWLSGLRITEAKKLLSEGGRNVKILKTAQAVGFNSKTAFNKSFKKQTGITPSEFIKSVHS